ncbi:MAG: hypothetical protein A3H02_02020 [Candidatus Niyogibacteria bacterium RIFCSPLOWO2_12_FULL_41_13]|uniref:Uncharacterized protein n=1 Tax=Candidatus Niyogibacteria bacterium RIFCSPLOWO2_12_FULL_41_13 TaxID=1801726 RepID=A0A1G2F3S1_9BACT|nr:MAG: hypothetical protein A3H02_02020 [Candidatus Niyogibacteria bacterium RIFCSPLOWO2_12_FULL_41_13]
MNKKFLIAAFILVVAALAMTAYFILRSKPKIPPKPVEKAKPIIEINPISNPLEKKPELNPIEKINPFKDIYKNPFE